MYSCILQLMGSWVVSSLGLWQVTPHACLSVQMCLHLMGIHPGGNGWVIGRPVFSFSTYRPEVFSRGCASLHPPHTRGGRELWLPTPSSRLGTFHKSKIALEALYTRVGLSGVNPCTVQKGGPASLVLACWGALGAISPWGLCRSGGLAGWGGQGLSLG